jgi:ubiquinone/menaquinone biosynthesis C-methylase UbiE
MPLFEKGRLLPAPAATRRGIPFYHAKTEAEFREDVYERYDELVTRQTALHLADELHGGYPFQALQEYLRPFLPARAGLAVADLGCSVGRLIGDLATAHPDWDCYGLDFSYQMLRQARGYWTCGETLRPNFLRYGWGSPKLPGRKLTNLRFALARAEALPFPDASLDLVINTFLIDRLPNAFSAFREWQRVLKPGGRLVAVSPLNFLHPDGWRNAHPPVKLLDHLQKNGWHIDDWTDPLLLHEPMDARGNAIEWRCVALVVTR